MPLIRLAVVEEQRLPTRNLQASLAVVLSTRFVSMTKADTAMQGFLPHFEGALTKSVLINLPDLSILTQTLNKAARFRRGSSSNDLYKIASKQSNRANIAKSSESR